MSRDYSRKELFGQCRDQISEQVSTVNLMFSSHEEDFLLTSPLPGKWNSKQCIEHLIATLDLYIPRVESALEGAPSTPKDAFKHGVIGHKFLTDINPNKDGSLNRKMKTFKALNPSVSGVSLEKVVDLFAQRMHVLSELIQRSQDKNVQKLRVTSAAGPLLRLRLGDVYPFLLNHNDRHILQAKTAIEINKKRKGLS